MTNDNALKVSFEFFPPKTEKMEANLWRAVQRLQHLSPYFVSVTYGAGGSTRERTHNTVVRIRKETPLTPAAHLTCVGASRAEVDAVAKGYWDAGIRHIVALRGDPPDGESEFTPHPDGYKDAADLVAGLRKVAPFEISVAAHPEGHPDSPDIEHDIENLKRKVAAGASRAITQYFCEVDDFLRFRDLTGKHGIDVPLVPGVLPVTNFARFVEFSEKCGATVPAWMAEKFDGLDDDPAARALVAMGVATEQCAKLRDEGCDTFHFYTLNRAELTTAICRVLGVSDGATDLAPAASQ